MFFWKRRKETMLAAIITWVPALRAKSDVMSHAHWILNSNKFPDLIASAERTIVPNPWMTASKKQTGPMR